VTQVKLTLLEPSAHLEVPADQIGKLAAQLGCVAEESLREVVLLGPSPGCSLHFDRVDALLLLRELNVVDDENGLFAVQVLGRLLAKFEGELEATLMMVPAQIYPARLVVRAGESRHPLFATVMPSVTPLLSPTESDLVDQLLAEAKDAWQAWQRSKQQNSNDPRSSG
jgi:hypothetical protein